MLEQTLSQQTLDELLLSRLTKEQKNAVTASGGTVLLSASAGSGKTSVLTTRILYMVTKRENPIDIHKLLILTFSNAAANEMKQRISIQLDALLMRFPFDTILQRQKILLNQTQISTIHSFCLELLREHFDKVNLSPDFKVLEEKNYLNLKDEILQELIEEYYEKEDADFQALVARFYSKNGQDRNLLRAIEQIYTYTRSYPFPMEWLKKSLDKYTDSLEASKKEWQQEILQHVSSMLQYCIFLFEEVLEKIRYNEDYLIKYESSIILDITNCRALLESIQTKTWDSVYEEIQSFTLGKVKAIRSNAKNYDPFCSKLIKEMQEQSKHCLKSIREDFICLTETAIAEDIQQQIPEIQKLYELVEQFYLRIKSMKHANNFVDFGDIEEMAVRLLVESKEGVYHQTAICKEAQEKYHEILIDEFQDTNRTQDLIFQCVSKDELNLFMVGDIKQSIYRFRKAMPEIFQEKQKRFHTFDGKTYPAHISMLTNFRSRKEVTNPINFLFSQIMSDELGEIDYGEDEALIAYDDYEERDEMDAEIQIIDVTAGKKDENATVIEARHIAHQIYTMIQNKVQVKDQNGYRPCRFEDFAILLRSASTKSQIYYTELQKQGISAWTKDSGGYFSSREIVVLLNLLRVLDNPLQDVPMLSVLLSEVFTFTPDDMAQIKIHHPKQKSLYNRLQSAAEGTDMLAQKCREFLQIFEDLRRESRKMPLSVWLQKLYNRLMLLEIAGAMEFGQQKQANLRLFIHYAEQSADAGYKELSDFVRYLEKCIENEVDFSAANIQTANNNAVKIMTIHNSKGLEFPICFVADCSKVFNKQDLSGDILMGGYNFAMKRVEIEHLKKYKTLPYIALALNNEKKMLSEEMRILYVALTRAKEKLIIVATASEKKGQELWESMTQSACLGLGQSVSIPPYKVFCAKSYFEWILLGAVRHWNAQRIPVINQYVQPLKLNSNATECGLQLLVYQPIADEEKPMETSLVFYVSAASDDVQRVCDQIDFVYPYASLTKIPNKLSVTQIVKEKQEPITGLTKRPKFMQKKSLTRAEIGTLNHTFLQYADFANAKKSVSAELERLIQEGFLDEDKAKKLEVKKLESFFRSPLYSRMEKAENLIREYKFMSEIPVQDVYKDVISDEHILIQGIADCILDEGETISIVDYKTDHASEEQIISRYKAQLQLYQAALIKIFEKPVKDMILYALTLEKEIYL